MSDMKKEKPMNGYSMTPEQAEEYVNIDLKYEEYFSIKEAAKIFVASFALILGITFLVLFQDSLFHKAVAAISLCVFVRLVMGSPTAYRLAPECEKQLRAWKAGTGKDTNVDIDELIRPE